MKSYTIDTDKPTNGPWRVTPFGAKYASVTFADGRKFFVGIEPVKKVRIPYKPRGTFGWRYEGWVRDATGKTIAADRVGGSLGVRGLLKMAGLLPDLTPTPDASIITV